MTKTIPRHGAPGAHETRAHKGGPARTGTLDAYRDAAGKRHYRGRIRLADGSRFRLAVPDGMHLFGASVGRDIGAKHESGGVLVVF